MPNNSSKPTLYAILIGIDKYLPGSGVSQLFGCKNDVNAWPKFLKKNYSEQLNIKDENISILTDDGATYDEVVKHLMEGAFLQKIRKEDVFFFVYSGHGSREIQAEAFNELYPEGKSETLVLYDSRGKDGKDLADKEIAYLLHEINKKCDNLTILLDCCHSGSGTRDIGDFTEGASRNLDNWDPKTDAKRKDYLKNGTRKFGSYLHGKFTELFPTEESVSIPDSNHILLSACDKKEKAREFRSLKRGAFSFCLMEALEKTPNALYTDLFEYTRARVRRYFNDQNPKIHPISRFNPFSSFLLNQESQDRLFNINKSRNDWSLNIGAQMGLPNDPHESVKCEILEDGKAVGIATVTKVNLNESPVEVKWNKDYDASKKTTLQARMLKPFTPPILILKQADAEGEKRLKTALDKYNPQNFKLEEDLPKLEYALIVEKELVKIENLSKNSTVVEYIGDEDEVIFEHVFGDLERIANWEKKLAIQNKKPQTDPDDLQVIFIDKRTNTQYTQETIMLETKMEGDNFEIIPFKIKIQNNSERTFHVSPTYFSEKFQVATHFTNDKIVEVPAGEPATLDFKIKTLSLKKEKSEATDIFKFFFSTEGFETRFLVQEKMKNYGKRVEIWKDGTVKSGPLRDFLEEDKSTEPDWFTKNLIIRVIGKRNEFEGKKLEVGDKVVITPPKNLNGRVGLTITESNGRSLDEYGLVTQMIEKLEGVELLDLVTERSMFGTPNSLDITGIQNEGILKDDPLLIEVSSELEEDEILLPVTFDGVFIQPIDFKEGKDGTFNFEINEIPETLPNRSLIKSFRLFFVKIKTGKLTSDTHQLRWVDYSSGLPKRQEKDIAKKIKSAENILLLIHGIIGNTGGMMKFAQPVLGKASDGKYDLILTYDYENLSSPINTTANFLLSELKKHGVKENDRKITILAHSMGGLVTRSFVEQIQGNKFVKKVILAGTPHKGSVLAKIADDYVVKWLPLIGFGFRLFKNPLSVKNILNLATGKYKANTLAQMTWDNEDQWLPALENANDPKVPYHLIAGNLEDFLKNNEEDQKLMNFLLEKGGELFYANEESDMVVSKDSMWGVDKNRNPAPKTYEVPAHHMNYFDVEESMEVIKRLLLG